MKKIQDEEAQRLEELRVRASNKTFLRWFAARVHGRDVLPDAARVIDLRHVDLDAGERPGQLDDVNVARHPDRADEKGPPRGTKLRLPAPPSKPWWGRR